MSWNPFEWLFQFITDAKKKLSHKVTVTVTIIAVVLIIDNTLGISFNYKMNNKLGQLKEVDLIIQNQFADSITKSYAVDLKREIMERRGWFDYLFSRTTSIISKTAKSNNPAAIAKAKESVGSKVLFYASTAGIFFLLAIVVFSFIIIGSLYNKEARSQFLSNLFEGLPLSFAIFFPGYLLNKWLEQIPLINGHLVNNYIFNFAIQIFVLFFLYLIIRYISKLGNKRKKRKKVVFQNNACLVPWFVGGEPGQQKSLRC